jgi:hypothetical protein
LRYFSGFFFVYPKWRLVWRWLFCHFKITLFPKNPLQSTTNTKIKVLIDLKRKCTQKKLSIGLQAEKNKHGAKNQDGCEFRIFGKILFPQHGLCLNL